MLKKIIKLARNLVCLLGLLCLMPLLFLAGLMIALEDGLPILYVQERLGKNKKIFRIIKIRTLKRNVPSIGTDQLQAIDMLKIGKWLRRMKIDELPQLINVLKGEMSLVGPRPLFEEDTEYFDKNYMRRLNVLPGMTGLLQVNDRNTDDFKIWYKYDLEYIENWNLRLDIEILIKTIFAVFNRKNSGK